VTVTRERKAALLGALFLAFLAVQVVVPALALLGERPARFGWQMYSAVPTDADFVVVDGAGEERPVEPKDYLGKVRGEIDLETVLPPAICAAEKDARLVRVVPRDGGGPTAVRCP
jgi:hypothetical protein